MSTNTFPNYEQFQFTTNTAPTKSKQLISKYFVI